MRISGFTFVRNAVNLYYPVVESIKSILPICDEFVVAAGDSTDGTTERIRAIDSPKLKIIETVWDPDQFVHGATNAAQTNIALDACRGDWAIYVQADEVVHEDDLPIIADNLHRYQNDTRVEGLLFDYLHFFADYDHYMNAHGWYRREVRIVRQGIGVRSWKSAQGFRRNGVKLRVKHSGARMFHYGWVRPPEKMTRKTHSFVTLHEGRQAADEKFPDRDQPFDYGRLHGRVPFSGSHPAVMKERIASMHWKVQAGTGRRRQDTFGNRLLTFIENRVLGFRLGEHKNFVEI